MVGSKKVQKNTFENGIVKDLQSSKLPASAIRASENIEYVEHEDSLSPTNIRGTSLVKSLISANYAGQLRVLRIEEVDMYEEDSGDTLPGAVVFVAHRNGAATNDQLLIFFFAQDAIGTTYYLDEMYSKTITGVYDYSADSVKFGENGLDYVYFTVVGGFIGKVECTWNAVTPVAYNDKDVILQKTGPQAVISPPNVIEDTTASLYAGTYMFAIRLLDTATDSYTKWSLLTNPAQVSVKVDINSFSEGVIGQTVGKRIDLDITVEANAVTATGYSHYQIAVIENIDGTTIPAALAYLQDIVPLVTSQTAYTYSYSANSTKNLVDVTEIVTDTAQIKHFNTINVKDNLLFGGGVVYKNLEYDNGDPVVGSVDYVLRNSGTIAESFRDDDFSSKYRGYFRGEVYRFYVSYYDEDYHFSFPKALDFSGVSGADSGDGTDLVFPDRYDTTYGHICNTNEEAFSLGARFNNIVNHPSWAIGMVILRAKRYKNVLGQAALVPTIKVEPALQRHGYPEYPNEIYPSGTGDDTIEPPDPLGIYVPKIFGGMIAKDIRRGSRISTVASVQLPEFTCPNGTSASSTKTDSARKFLLYSPEFIYTSAGNPLGDVNDIEGASIAPVDAVLLNGKRDTGANHVEGKLENYSATTFYAYNANDYFNAAGRASGRDALKDRGTQKLREAHLIPIGGSAVTSLGRYGDYALMQPTVITDGYTPSAQKAVVAVVDDPRIDIAYESLDAAVSTTQMLGSNTYGYGPAGTSKIASANISFDTNQFDEINDKVSALEIVNIVRGLGSQRYGDPKKQWEAIHTGAEVKLASKGAATALTTEVWGGDCFIGKFNFKPSDRGYALVNPTQAVDLDTTSATHALNVQAKDDWGKWFAIDNTAGGTTYNKNCPRPVGVHALAETVSVYIESEANASLDYKDSYRIVSTFSETDASASGTGYNGNVGGGAYNATWATMSTGSMTNFSSASDVSASGSLFGQFSNVSCINVFTATAPATGATLTLNGTITWTRIGGTGIISNVVIEKLNSSNIVQEVLVDQNDSTASTTLVHTINVATTVTLAVGDKLRFIIEGTEDSAVIYPGLTGGLNFSLGTGSAILAPSQEFEYLLPFTYRYNGGYSVENESKVFFPEPEGFKARDTFRSRVHYSEQKVYQTSKTGFDTWPVNNFYDLDETFGKVTKLARVKNNMMALMDQGLLALPINANVMQTADGQSLSIRSADVIGIPQVLSSQGCKNINAVENKHDKLIYVDNEDSNIILMDEEGHRSISEGKMESFFHENIGRDDLDAATRLRVSYDKPHNKIIISKGTNFNYVYNATYKIWETNRGIFDPDSYQMDGLINLDNETYLIGLDDSNANRLRIDKDYDETAPRGQWFDQVGESSISFKANSEPDVPKAFDAFVIDGDMGLRSMEVNTESLLGSMATGEITSLGTDIDGTYKIKKFLNILSIGGKTGQRIRGNTALVKINWDNEQDVKTTVNSVLTKYRLSRRII